MHHKYTRARVASGVGVIKICDEYLRSLETHVDVRVRAFGDLGLAVRSRVWSSGAVQLIRESIGSSNAICRRRRLCIRHFHLVCGPLSRPSYLAVAI